ncbi:MAG: creatininase family protein [Firmicutes bacterium]|nr:creatininase family protein [Bacillota bacterium]
MTNVINEMPWSEFDKRRKTTDLVIIPTGACEIYGTHLPMGSDAIAADGVARCVAEKCNALIAPCFPLADSSMLLAYPGTLTITPRLFEMYIEELMAQLYDYGFRKFLFITGHAASNSTIMYVARKYQEQKGCKWAQVDWWRFVMPLGKDIFDTEGRMCHGHAAEAGTSVILYFRPDLVDMSKATKVTPNVVKFPDIQTFVPMQDKTPSATVGDATVGTAEKGKAVVEKAVARICEFLKEEWAVEIK